MRRKCGPTSREVGVERESQSSREERRDHLTGSALACSGRFRGSCVFGLC